ncbi:MAG: hypothetical protein J0M01_14230 [Dechloromonas sp.]|nr:hypothetical protein [Dechloromonas sp.]
MSLLITAHSANNPLQPTVKKLCFFPSAELPRWAAQEMDPQVTASIISAIGTIVGAVIASVAAVLVGKTFLSREKLKGQLDAAVADIAFLLKVEERHCELHQESSGQSNKQRVRDHVTSNGGTWSGRFTPGRYRSNSGAA